MDPEVIQRFVESVGKKADVELYLKLFRSQRKESFAIISADAQILKTALDPLHFDLRILTGLGLIPVVLIGVLDAKEADDNARRVFEWLHEDQVPAQIIGASADLGAPDLTLVRHAIATNQIPIVSLQAARAFTAEARFGTLARLASALETRKVIFLSTGVGVERRGAARIDVVNLATDYDHLLTGTDLPRRNQLLLRRTKSLLDVVPHRMNVTVVNPLHLLRELFTVSGSGTLIRKGSRIETHRSLDTLDRERLEGLIESAFGRKLRAGALEQPWERIYLEENYRGAAMLLNSAQGAYLSKFAVERQAQGDGIGGDIWNLVLRDYSRFFWRGRADNPIDPWYTRKCDGLVRLPDWHVFWYGVEPAELASVIEFAAAQPRDLEPL
ncbi:MAG: hypothetical protein KA712_06650 [Myxococcales bacterium]|nr:hypothetical protein [Myxococcales bacterium]